MTSVASNQLLFSKHCLLIPYGITSNAKCRAALLGRGISPVCEMGLCSGFDLPSKFPNRERSCESVWHWVDQLTSSCARFLSSPGTESFPLGAPSLSRWVTPGPEDTGRLAAMSHTECRCRTASGFLWLSLGFLCTRKSLLNIVDRPLTCRSWGAGLQS